MTCDLVSLSYTARHLYAVWSHLPITIGPHSRGAKNKAANNQRRDDFRALQKEAKEFVILHDLPVFINRTLQVVMDLPVADIHDSKDDAFGADEALPLFILIMVRANPPMMASVLSYAESFTARQQLRTEQGYALAQALSNLSPGEWERHIDGEDVQAES
ncbi:hypothetical protein AK812_SmicGene27340 [Symbiodinium microadriaticum]|uniref:VPS9 domain-containing protein n=1 Tax=Symbiodinium microadriaticum TaxID=2951 RepID=A0A1Q9D737_SYMMI|nr:hypothetical protein AK812_SmicGene27340 [Symbiodinium microadriaticum]